MSLPNEPDFAIVKMGDGAATEVFTQICGIVDVTINKGVATTDRIRRDCTKPGEVPQRKVRVNSKQMDVTGSMVANADEIENLEAAIGASKNYQIELRQLDGTDAGLLLGTYAGPYVLTTDNMSLSRDGDGTGEVTLASDGAWTYTAAP